MLQAYLVKMASIFTMSLPLLLSSVKSNALVVLSFMGLYLFCLMAPNLYSQKSPIKHLSPYLLALIFFIGFLFANNNQIEFLYYQF